MSYFLKFIVFIVNVALVLSFFGGTIYSLYNIFSVPMEWVEWIILFALCFLGFVVSTGLYILRKSKLPLPGIDYK